MSTVTTGDRLRQIIGSPSDVIVAKVSDRLNDLTRQFVERAPFVCVATCRPDGGLDISPRGDPAGFVQILDDRRLLIPERPGNRLADTLTNLLADPLIALLFLIPGVGDTLRVNGRAILTTEATLLEPLAVEGKTPKLGLLVDVDEVFTHCSKAFIRSDLWNPERHIERNELPSQGEILHSLDSTVDAGQYDVERAERYARREGIY